MPTYRVRSGDMCELVKVPHAATPPAIFFMALRQMMDKPVQSLGTITEITGGQYVGDKAVYGATDVFMMDAGLLRPNALAAAEARIAELEAGKTEPPSTLDTRPLCYSCGCRSDRERNWQGRSICTKCSPKGTR